MGQQGVKKEAKLYMWDWSLVENEGARFENLIASHLLKFCNFLEDTAGYKMELLYLRDVIGHEVDFLVAVDRKPWIAVECKIADTTPSSHLSYFRRRLNIPYSYHVVRDCKRDFVKDGVRVMPAAKFLSGLV